MLSRRAILVALACALALPPSASAQAPQPDSPAGVEYELPLDQTRKDFGDGGNRDGGAGRDGGPSKGSGGGGTGAAPLFGVGISRAGGGSDGGDSDGGASGGGSSQSDSRSQDGDPPSGDRADGAGTVSSYGGGSGDETGPPAAQASSEAGFGSNLLVLGLALTVLLVGGLLGLVLRRDAGQTPTA